MILGIMTVTIFYIIFIHPFIKDFTGGYQSQYDTIMDNYIDLQLTKRYKYKQK